MSVKEPFVIYIKKIKQDKKGHVAIVSLRYTKSTADSN